MKILEYAKTADAPHLQHFFGENGCVLEEWGSFHEPFFEAIGKPPIWVNESRPRSLTLKFGDSEKYFSLNYYPCHTWIIDAEDQETALRAIMTIRNIFGRDNKQLAVSDHGRCCPALLGNDWGVGNEGRFRNDPKVMPLDHMEQWPQG